MTKNRKDTREDWNGRRNQKGGREKAGKLNKRGAKKRKRKQIRRRTRMNEIRRLFRGLGWFETTKEESGAGFVAAVARAARPEM